MKKLPTTKQLFQKVFGGKVVVFGPILNRPFHNAAKRLRWRRCETSQGRFEGENVYHSDLQHVTPGCRSSNNFLLTVTEKRWKLTREYSDNSKKVASGRKASTLYRQLANLREARKA